jgi:two-component system chemotaxis sensor kinase CheA
MSRQRSIGVRGKLIGLLVGTAFVSLVLACTAFVVYDRQSYAAAKQRTLSVLVGSVAQSAFGPTAFQDPDSAAVILKVLDAEPSAVAGAIYTQDGGRLVGWQKPGAAALPDKPVAVADGFHGERLRISRDIENPEGKVGRLVVVFSTADIQARTERFLLLAAGVLLVSVLLALVVATLAQRVLTRPVHNLATAAHRVQEHQDFDVRAERVSNDELGRLTDAFNEMLSMIQNRDRELAKHRVHLEDLVAQRTADLDRRNREMRLVMDHVDQGFITIDLDGAMAAERSAVVDRWFGPLAAGDRLADRMRDHDPTYAAWLAMGLEQLRDDALPPALVMAQLPTSLSAAGRSFAVDYTGIGQGDQIERVLVIITDVTDARARAAAESEQRELVTLFQRVSTDRVGVEEFLAEGAALVAALRTERDDAVSKRLIHTIKGNCAIYGLESVSALAHRVETELAETGGEVGAGERARLVAGWKEAMSRIGVLLGPPRRDLVEVERDALEGLAVRLQDELPRSGLSAQVGSWLQDPVARRLERLGQQATAVAARLGRPAPSISIETDGLRVAGDGWSPFWASMVHVVRNAVDHGIESGEERVRAGKPAAGHLELRARRDGRTLVFSLRDDGRGIDWEAVRARATAAGLPAASRADLVHALFADGLSTRSEASELSGRGVGLGALRQVVIELGGSLDVESEPGRGTTFRFCFEEQATAALMMARPRSRASSLLPFTA